MRTVRIRGHMRHLLLSLGLIAAGLTVATAARLGPSPDAVDPALPATLEEVRAEVDRLIQRENALSNEIERLERTDRVVVDTALNQLFLVSNGQIVLAAPCSTGSGEELIDPVDGRKWTFDTPRGQFRISSRSRNPVWRKPDWAFIEEGQRPPTNDASRFEAGVLGDYALGFGDGYFIHGTLYTRLIGQNVTHGCIRLGDEDLEALVARTKVGTTLLVF